MLVIITQHLSLHIHTDMRDELIADSCCYKLEQVSTTLPVLSQMADSRSKCIVCEVEVLV